LIGKFTYSKIPISVLVFLVQFGVFELQTMSRTTFGVAVLEKANICKDEVAPEKKMSWKREEAEF